MRQLRDFATSSWCQGKWQQKCAYWKCGRFFLMVRLYWLQSTIKPRQFLRASCKPGKNEVHKRQEEWRNCARQYYNTLWMIQKDWDSQGDDRQLEWGLDRNTNILAHKTSHIQPRPISFSLFYTGTYLEHIHDEKEKGGTDFFLNPGGRNNFSSTAVRNMVVFT